MSRYRTVFQYFFKFAYMILMLWVIKSKVFSQLITSLHFLDFTPTCSFHWDLDFTSTNSFQWGAVNGSEVSCKSAYRVQCSLITYSNRSFQAASGAARMAASHAANQVMSQATQGGRYWRVIAKENYCHSSRVSLFWFRGILWSLSIVFIFIMPIVTKLFSSSIWVLRMISTELLKWWAPF